MRPFKPPSFERLKKYDNLAWNLFSKDDLEYNTRIVYSEVKECYRIILQSNFPLLSEELALNLIDNQKATDLLIILDLKDNYTGLRDFPKIERLWLKSKDEKDFEIEVKLRNEIKVRDLRRKSERGVVSRLL